ERALAVFKVQWLPLVVISAALFIAVGVPGALVEKWLPNFPLLVLLFKLAIMVAVAGPVMIGLARYILRLFENPEQSVDIGAAFNTVLEGYQQLKDAAVLYLVIGGSFFVAQYALSLFLWPFLAVLASAVVSFFVATATMFSVWLMAEHKCGFQAALSGSWSAVKDNFHVFLVFHLMALGVGIAGVIGCGIGVVATMPLYLCLMAVAFREVFPHVSAEEPSVPAAL
ncbi:MAG: hypothetical protein NTY53_24030, partial [Kiritimatiellaeota bacterium]|nr:hypothetical protein [Kiritimatiellota bacterium]